MPSNPYDEIDPRSKPPSTQTQTEAQNPYDEIDPPYNPGAAATGTDPIVAGAEDVVLQAGRGIKRGAAAVGGGIADLASATPDWYRQERERRGLPQTYLQQGLDWAGRKAAPYLHSVENEPTTGAVDTGAKVATQAAPWLLTGGTGAVRGPLMGAGMRGLTSSAVAGSQRALDEAIIRGLARRDPERAREAAYQLRNPEFKKAVMAILAAKYPRAAQAMRSVGWGALGAATAPGQKDAQQREGSAIAGGGIAGAARYGGEVIKSVTNKHPMAWVLAPFIAGTLGLAEGYYGRMAGHYMAYPGLAALAAGATRMPGAAVGSLVGSGRGAMSNPQEQTDAEDQEP